jgi:hypothetical protein
MDAGNYFTASDVRMGTKFHYAQNVTNSHAVLNFKTWLSTQVTP